MVRAYLGIGSNLGDRLGHLRYAFRELAWHGALVARSPVIETEPIGCPTGGPFLNACAGLDTDLAPRGLLEAVMRIERRHGRLRGSLNAPRTLDIDLLLVGQLCIEERGLVVPHPRMCERRFVLEPLATIAPRVVHPGRHLTVREMLDRLRDGLGGLDRKFPGAATPMSSDRRQA